MTLTYPEDLKIRGLLRWFSVYAIDEAHKCTGEDTQIAYVLHGCHGFKILSTGTPVQNDVADLRLSLAFCAPEDFPSKMTRKAFRLRYQESNKDVKDALKQLTKTHIRRVLKS